MKNTLVNLILIFPLLALLTSCGDDDESNTPIVTSIVGNYHEIEQNKVSCPNSTENNIDPCDPVTDTCDSWEFTEDGKAILTYGYGGNSVFDYTFQNNKLTLISNTGSGIFNYSSSNGIITLTEDGTSRCLTQYVLKLQ